MVYKWEGMQILCLEVDLYATMQTVTIKVPKSIIITYDSMFLGYKIPPALLRYLPVDSQNDCLNCLSDPSF